MFLECWVVFEPVIFCTLQTLYKNLHSTEFISQNSINFFIEYMLWILVISQYEQSTVFQWNRYRGFDIVFSKKNNHWKCINVLYDYIVNPIILTRVIWSWKNIVPNIIILSAIKQFSGGGGAHWNSSLWFIITWCIRCNRHGEHLQAIFTWYNVVMKCIRGQCRLFGNIHVSRLPAAAHWGRHFADILKCIFVNENVWISINISLKSVPKGPSNNISALVQIIAWHRSGDKTLFEAMMAYFSDAHMR